MKINYQNSYATLYINADRHIGHLEWSGIVPSDCYRETMLRVLNEIQQHNIFFGILDVRKLRKLSYMDTDWMAHEFMPMLLTSPLNKIAILEAENNIDTLNLCDMVYTSYTQLPFKLQYFDDVSSALSWFKETISKQVTFDVPRSVATPAFSIV